MKWSSFIAPGAVLALGALSVSAAAQPIRPPANDYSNPDNWLCHPGKTDGACLTDQDATEILPDGSTRVLPFQRAEAPAFDCFYVYPTASLDQTPYSDMNPGREIAVATAQFGRYGAVCRQFAPIYRSFTLTALRARITGDEVDPVYPNLNYLDVIDAWNHYLEHENNGRGVILVGHSQGSGLLTRLIVDQIEGTDVEDRIIAAHTMGTTVQVSEGEVTAGTYEHFPLCSEPDQFGCVVVYGTYRDTLPPSIDPPARFGRGLFGSVASCVNPAAVGGGAAEMDVYQTTGTADWAPGKTIETPFVRLPGLARGECVTNGDYTYLQVSVINPDSETRRNVLTGDVGTPPDPTWGLHNGDMSVAIGDLVSLAASQGAAWLEAHGE